MWTKTTFWCKEGNVSFNFLGPSCFILDGSSAKWCALVDWNRHLDMCKAFVYIDSSHNFSSEKKLFSYSSVEKRKKNVKDPAPPGCWPYFSSHLRKTLYNSLWIWWYNISIIKPSRYTTVHYFLNHCNYIIW